MIGYIEKPCCAKPFKQHSATTHCEAYDICTRVRELQNDVCSPNTPARDVDEVKKKAALGAASKFFSF